MAGTRTGWGIDIGQAGLKAIRLRAEEDGGVRVLGFDYVPHPKILSQPDAIPEELIHQAVETFVGRNKFDGDFLAVSVPGQTSLAKFIKLPPVEPGKVAEIVQYEARQQIPFDLNEVVWDYQPIGGGVEESGFMLEAEVGLFAMKRELIYSAMRPLTDRNREVELVQIAPLGLYNFLSYDVLGFRPTPEQPNPPDSEDYYIVLDIGADNSTLLVSNGQSIWIRNVPVGGNHFTRALTREMKLTFAKAEHLKCNATKAPDPKAVFQAMRPVFNDFVTEIQRSIGYFGSVKRSAKISKVIGVGNGFKLAGLQKFLQQNLQYDVERLEQIRGVSGESVLNDPLFADNIMAFAVPYGLALQVVDRTRIRTNLLPPEIVVDRKIRRKKPWAVAAAAGFMLATGIGAAVGANHARSVSDEKFAQGFSAVSQLKTTASGYQSAYQAEKARHEDLVKKIDLLTAPLQKRELWMELHKAINECLPQEEGSAVDVQDPTKQPIIRVEQVVTKKVADLSEWFTALEQSKVRDEGLEETTDEGADSGSASEESAEAGPTGAGYVVTVTGYHYYDDEDFRKDKEFFVRNTLVNNLGQWVISRNGQEIPVGKLGISHPHLVHFAPSKELFDPNARRGGAGMTGGGYGGGLTGGEGFDGGASGPGRGYPGAMGMPGGGYPGGGGRGMPSMGAPGMGLSGGGNIGGGPDMGIGGEGLAGGGYSGEGYSGGGQLPGAATPNRSRVLDTLDPDKSEARQIDRTDFVVQFAWIPTPLEERQDSPDGAAGGEGEGEGAEE